MTAMHGSAMPVETSRDWSRSASPPRWGYQGMRKGDKISSLAQPRDEASDGSPGFDRKPKSRREGKRKDASVVAAICAWIVEHQIGQSSWRTGPRRAWSNGAV